MIQIKNLKEAELFGAIINTVAQANRFTKTISSHLIASGDTYEADLVRNEYKRLQSYINNACTSVTEPFMSATSGLIRAIKTYVQQCGDVLDAAVYDLPRPTMCDDFLELSDLTCEVSGLMTKYDEYVTWFYTTVINHLNEGSLKPVDPSVDNTDIENFLNKVSMQEALQDIVDHTPRQDFEAAPATKMSDAEVKNKLQEVADDAKSDDKSLDTISDDDVNKMLIDAANSDNEDDDDPFKDAIEASEANDEDEDPFKDDDDAETTPVKSETTPKKATKKKQTKTKAKSKS